MKLLAAAVTALVVAGVGCSGCHEWPAECSEVSGQFDGLSENAQITVGDDVDPDTEGIQIDVAVLAVDQCGQAVDITRATLEESDKKTIDFHPGPDAVLKGNRAEFHGVTLPPGLRVIKVAFFTAREPENPIPVTVTLNVYDANARPQVVSFTFAGDGNDDGKLNAAELGDTTPVAELEIGNIEDGQPVQVQDRFSGEVYGTGEVSGTHASVTLDGLPDPRAGTYELVAHVTNSKGLDNKIADPLPDDPLNDAAFRTLTIDVTPPMLTLLEPAESDVLLGPADDAIADVSGFQLTVSGTAAPAEDVLPDVTIEMTGQEPVTVQHTDGSIFTHLDLPATGTNAYVLKVTVRDGAGNTAELTRSFTVDYEPPVVAIASPSAAGGPYDRFELPLSATVSGVPDGTVVHFFTQPAGTTQRTPLVDLPVAGGVASDEGVTFPGGKLDVIAEVADEVGNVGTDVEPNVEVQGTGCSIQLSAPAGSPARLMSSNDTAPGTPDLQFNVTGDSSNCPNNPVEVYIGASPTPVTGTTDSSGHFSVNVTLPEGGPIALKVQMTDAFNATHSVTSQVTVDLTPPAITFPANNATFNTSFDLQALQPGAQQNFTYTPAPDPGTRVDVCITSSAAGTTPCPDGAGGWFLLASNVGNATSGFTYPDGVYQLKAVELVDPSNSGFNVSAPINLTVDTVRPTVTGFQFVNDMNGDNCLNASESPSGTPSALVTVSESGVTVQLQNATTGANIGSSVGPSVGTTVTVPVAVGSATESDFPLLAIVTDAHGNKNALATPVTTDPAYVLFRLDRVGPATTIQAPTKNELNAADDADPLAANYQLRIAALTATDVGTDGVDISVTNATSPGPRTPNGSGQVTADVTLPSTGTTSHTITLTATDKCGNVGATATKTVTVDRDPPAIACVEPTNAAPYGTFAIPTTAQVTGAEGSIVHVYTTVTGSPEVELQSLPPVSGGTTSATITYPNGTQDVRMEVADSAGNTAQCTVPGVEVNGIGCSILINSPAGNPALLNASNDGHAGTPATWEGVLTGSSSTCAGRQAWLYRGTGPGRVLLAGPVNADGSGNFSFNFALGEGSFTLEVEMDNGAGVLTQAQRNVLVDLTPPVLSNVSPSGANLFFVAATNSHLIPTAQPGYVADGSPGGDAEVNVGLTVTGAAGGSASVIYAGATVGGPVAITTSPQTISIPVVLPHDTTGSFVIQVTDAGGNVVSQTSSAVVDVIAPGVPAVTQTVASGQERTAKVNLSWTPVNDDGNVFSSGAPAGYDVRWTTNAVTDSGIGSDADYFSTTLVKAEPLVLGTASTKVLDVPPLAQYWISVRAVDEVGNYSAFVPPAPLSNFLTKTTFQNPSATSAQFYGFAIASGGSLDGEATDDLVVSAQVDGPGAVYVYFGGPNFTTQAPQKIVPPPSPPAPGNDNAAQSFGADISVGKASDSSADLLIASPTWSRPGGSPAYPNNTGRVFLYFGGSNPIDTSTFVEFRGNPGTQLGRTAQIINDLNGDGFGEVAIAAPNDFSNQGKVYIFYGRPKGDAMTPGSWLYLQATGGGFVAMSAANIVIEGPTPIASGGNRFGRNRLGMVSLGNIDGVPGNEFTVPDSWDLINKVFVFSGQVRPVTAPQLVLQTGTGTTPNDALQTLTQGPPGGGGTFGFGTCVRGNFDGLGGTGSDLLVTDSRLSKAYLFADATGTGYGPLAATISGVSNSFFGFVCDVRDINQDGSPDLLLGGNVASNGVLSIFYNRNVAGQEYDAVVRQGFAQSRLSGVGTLGVSVAVGDFTGDGKPDIASGDSQDGTGKVFVWH